MRDAIRTDDLDDYLDGLQQAGRLHPITEAPKDTEFKAVLADTGETVTAFYRHDYKHYVNEDRWQDANGDDAPDGHCRTWGEEDFAGWLTPAGEAS